jgi:hypothetical protein
MIPAGNTAALAAAQGAMCAECGTAAQGNFCSSCGADLRAGRLAFLGSAAGTVRRSYPAIFLQMLRSPVKTTVGLADDPSYRSHLSFLLTGVALFCLLYLPILMSQTIPQEQAAHLSDSAQTMLKVLSQVGVYAGTVIGFLLSFGFFRAFAATPRTFAAYFKLYCLAFGFMSPLYAVYEFAMRKVFDGTGMTAFNSGIPQAQAMSPSAYVSIVLSLALWAYFIAIHRRFWHMPLWKAGALYVTSAVLSYYASFWLMFYVGRAAATVLIELGIVTV